MRKVICQKFCSYYKPEKDEAEKCLAFELLNAWSGWAPKMAIALAAAPGTTGSLADGVDLLPPQSQGVMTIPGQPATGTMS